MAILVQSLPGTRERAEALKAEKVAAVAAAKTEARGPIVEATNWRNQSWQAWAALAFIAAVIAIPILVALLSSLAHAGSTVQRDASTTRFYDSRGSVTGSASTYGNTTRFYAPDGKPIGSAQTLPRSR
jgi:hypothetical protein